MERLGAGTLTEIRKEAAAWLIEMDLDPERWDRQAFIAWFKSSPRHMDEFVQQSALLVGLYGLPQRGMDADVRELLKSTGNIVDWPRSSHERKHDTPRPKHRWRWFTSLAATALIFASAVVWSLLQDNTEVLTTAIGEQRAVRLADRSVVYLNTDSQIEIRFTNAVREVRLVRGEALFSVERDVGRPFRVQADEIQVEALGTQFNVRRRASDTIVSVVEGRVAVVNSSEIPPSDDTAVRSYSESAGQQSGTVEASGSPSDVPYEAGLPAPAGTLAVVKAGEQVRVSVDGGIEGRETENVTAATAWRERQLVFSNTPLSEVVAEVARYNVAPQIVIESAALQARELNGVFAADDPDALIQFLARDAALSVTRSGDTVIVRMKEAAGG